MNETDEEKPLRSREDLVHAIANKIYETFVRNQELKGPLSQEAVQKIIAETVIRDEESANQQVYQSNCVVESKNYFGEEFKPKLHHSELVYEDLPKPVTEFNKSSANGKKVKENVLHFLEKGKRQIFRDQDESSDSNGLKTSKTKKKQNASGLYGKWGQVRQKIFPLKKSSSSPAALKGNEDEIFKAIPVTVCNADAEFDKLYQEMKACGQLAAEAEAEVLKATDRKVGEFTPKGYEYVKTAPLEDPSIILTSPKPPRHKMALNNSTCSSTLVPDSECTVIAGQNSDYAESLIDDIHGVQEDSARVFIGQAIDKKQDKFFSNILPVKPMISHFEELKLRQKEQQAQFQKKLMTELPSCTGKARSHGLFNKPEQVHIETPKVHLFDPFGHQPNAQIPRPKSPLSPATAHVMPSPRNSQPRDVVMSGEYKLDETQAELSFSSRSLPRAKRKVKFEDEAPERPPPPAPERQNTSFKTVNALQRDRLAKPQYVPTIDAPDNYQQFAQEMDDAGGVVWRKSISNPNLPLVDHDNIRHESEHKTDHWFEKYGKAVLIDSADSKPVNNLPRGDTLSAMKGKVSHVRQLLEEQEFLVEKQKTMSLNRKSVKKYKIPDQQETSNYRPTQQGSCNVQGFSTTSDKWRSSSQPTKFSYVRQYLMEQEAEERLHGKQEECKSEFSATVEERPQQMDAVKRIVLNILRAKGMEPTDKELEEAIKDQVFVGSASDGILYPGDKVTSINYQDTSKLTHLQTQNAMKTAGTSVKLDIVRPSLQGQRGSVGSQGSSDSSNVGPQQPYRTKPLTLPSAKSHIIAKLNDVSNSKKKAVVKPLPIHSGSFQNSALCLHKPNPQKAARTVVDAINNKQPFRTTPLVSPTPRTINEVHSSITGRTTPLQNMRANVKPLPSSRNNSLTTGTPQQVRQVNIGGTQKQIVSNQFNSPMGMYSDDALVEAAGVANQLSDEPHHPGYVQSSRPHLPTPKDGTFGTRAKPSETFKIVLEAEMDKAKNQSGVVSSEFSKHQPDRSSSSMSNRSNYDVSI